MPDPSATLSSPATILIGDDDADLCHDLAALLEMEGHAAQIATSGPAAIAAIEKIPFRLVILDVSLQEIDGIHIARFLRKRWPASRIAIHSGASEADVRDRFDDYDAYFPKGGAGDSILQRVRRLMA